MKQPLLESNDARYSETEVMATSTLSIQKSVKLQQSRSMSDVREWDPSISGARVSYSLSNGRSKSTHRLMNQPPLRQRVDAEPSHSRALSTGSIRRSSTNLSGSSRGSSALRPEQGEHRSITRAILDLREKREQAQSRRIHHRDSSRPQSGTHQQAQQARAQSLGDSATGSQGSVEEHQATNRLKQAETKITSLMDELDELRFFNEIEAASPSPTSKEAKRLARPQGRSAPGTPSERRPRKQERKTALSPRRLSAMDRVSLELETQQLQRQVDILEQERTSLEATVEMDKRTIESHQEDTKRIQLLEKALNKVKSELSRQLEELQSGRTKLVQEYEEKLSIVQREYQTTRDTANELLESLQETQQALELLQKRHVSNKEEARRLLEQSQTEKEEREEFWAKEKSRLNVKLDTMTQSLSDHEATTARLQKQVEDYKENLETTKTSKDDSYELRIEVLTQQLSLVKDQYDKLRADNEQQQEILEEREQMIRAVREMEESQKNRLAELQSRFDDQQSKHETELEELKTSLEERERRRLDDLVLLQQDSNQEYERRLKALQEQLVLATDRHQSEMEQKEKDMQAKVEAAVSATKREAVDEYESKLKDANEEKMLVQVKYEEAKEENLRRQFQTESQGRDITREWERKDALRQGELDRMNDKLDRTIRMLAEKEDKVQSLQEKISEVDQRHRNEISDVEAHHAEELAAREEILTNQRKTLKFSESKLRTELTRKESELVDIRDSMEAESARFRDEIEQLRRALASANKGSRSEEQLTLRMTAMQTAMDNAQKDFIAEKARHESMETEMRGEIAKLEGKLAAADSSLKEKRTLVEELECRLADAGEKSSIDLSTYQNQIMSLRRDLDASQGKLEKTQRDAEEKDDIIGKLQKKNEEDQQQLRRIATMEESISRLEESLAEAETEKLSHIDNVSKLQDCLRVAEEKALDSRRRLAMGKEDVSAELMGKDDQINELTEKYENAIAEQKRVVQKKSSEKTALQSEIDDLRSKLEEAQTESESQNEDSKTLKKQVADLKSQVEKHQKAADRAKASSTGSVRELRRQLEDAEDAQDAVAEKLDGLLNEKAEVIEALEQVIAEVQSREEEIEALSSVLRKRDEELEHAKLIATKAIASAQEIKTRYKQKGAQETDIKGRFREQIDEMNESLVYVTEKHDQLKYKTQRLEAELQNKTMECAQLKDLLNEAHSAADQGGASRVSSSRSLANDGNPNGLKKGFKLMEKGFISFEDDQHSTSQSESGMLVDSSMSTATAELGDATKWIADFEMDQPLDDAHSEPGLNKSRHSMERDALRKYVRKRYLKRDEEGKLHNI